ncbi:MAG: LPS-assembly protein LptD, partial [Sphingobacteriales bacterium]
MKYAFRAGLMFIFTFGLTNAAIAQAGGDTTVPDSVTLKQVVRSIAANDSSRTGMEDSLGIRISKDALPAPVTATSTDSAVLDVRKNIFYLYGDATISHEDLKLTAGQISYDQATSNIIAQPTFDSVGGITKRPSFAQGSETVTYDSLQYNFKSKRAIIRNARSQYGEGYVFSQQVKRNPDQSIYGWKNVYTTCSLDTPHYGIRAQKIKVIPNKVIASASANIVIEQVPTPIVLPFGLFPITQRQRSGFQMPSYTIEQQRGLGLTNGGYYFHFNDYVDFLLLANIYTKGSYNVSGITNYANRYRYSGGFVVNYAYSKTGENYEPGAFTQRDFSIQWRHQTDPKARPGVNFNANVNIASNTFYSNNSYNVNQILQNQLTSSVSYSKNWLNKPYSLTVGARHSQNLGTGEIRLTVPDASFFVSQFNPFENKNRIGAPKWYERITASYNVVAQNQAFLNDSTFSLGTLTPADFQNGIKHSLPVSANYTLLRFINVSFNTNFTEYWLTQRQFRYFNAAEGNIDTIAERGFYAARDFNANVSMSTRIYGVKLFRKGNLMGIRHVITPTVGAGYVPDYAAAPFRYYYQTRLDTSAQVYYESPYAGSIIGTPGLGQYGRFASNINFGINNNLQIKVRSKGDTTGTGRNITLIDGFSINSAYNVAADSFNWSNINIDFRTNILNKLNLTAGARFDPYSRDSETGRRIPQTVMSTGKGLARFVNGSISMNAGFRSKQNEGGEARPVTTVRNDEYSLLMQNGGYYNYIDFNIPWSLNIAYGVTVNRAFSRVSRRDTSLIDQFVTFSGDFNLTSRWKIAFNSGYDFNTKGLT